MTCLDVYVGIDSSVKGNLPFVWEGGNWSGNQPPGIGPMFPSCVSSKPFWLLHERMNNGEYEYKQTDWAAGSPE